MGNSIELLLNEDQRVHGNALVGLLKRAQQLECMVAFAKESALLDLLGPLEKALARGMKARFAVGLSFHLTEPAMLRKLFDLTKKYKMALYLSATEETFHPKIYAVREPGQCRVIVGSANLTAGGLTNNYEASVLVNDQDGTLVASVEAHFDELVTEKSLVQATKKLIDTYALEFAVHDAWRKMAKMRADKINRDKSHDFAVLAYKLEKMKRDASSHGFAEQQVLRQSNLALASSQINSMTTLTPADDFLSHYEALINLFHSGGLHRAKTRIATTPSRFLAAIVDIVGRRDLTPAAAFGVLHGHFENLTGAGINLLTEILHAIDNKRYAVMNQNAVAGLMVAGFRDYPEHPSKQNVDGELYDRYCQNARAIQKDLGLANLTELDALFNYVYWQLED